MSVRSRAGAPGSVLAAKAFGGDINAPPAMVQAAEGVSQMGPDHPFAPGIPVGPFEGYDRTPRTFDYVTSYNVATRPRTHERVSFDTLRGLVEAYDVAEICIWHRIDSIRGLEWQLVAADGYTGDVTDAAAIGKRVLKKPDGRNSFSTWLAKWLYDALAYDAAALYRLRNRAGRVVGLAPVDGTTIAPLLDYWGNSPQEPAEAYVQYVNGLPWNWLTRSDLIYEPFRPRTNSPYGRAPIESILLNANTDIRFQLYFLQRFTQGNVPEAFASAPETWDPTQIEQFQALWDAMLYGDQSRKHQIRWMPGGAKIAWSNEKDFTDDFSLFLMRKTCACFHVVPSDLGFTETVNLASSESQVDVQHRVGELPLDDYIENLITAFLQDDLGLPIAFQFDKGEEQEDQYAQAQSDQIYIQNGSVSASEIREMRFGLAEPVGQVVPRFIMTSRSGPVPLASLMGVAGKVDPATGAPVPGTELPHMAFTEVPGVVPTPPLEQPPLAEQEFGPKAIPPAPPDQAIALPKATDPAHQVAKEGEGAPTAGVTAETGIYGYDGPGEDDEDGQAVAKEMAAFRRFARSRQRAGTWRDFRFDAVSAGTARALNDEGRAAVAKAGDGGDPKGWPGWALNKRTVAYWAPLLAAAAAKSLTPSQAKALAAQWLAENPEPVAAGSKREANAAAADWLDAHGVTFSFGAIAAGIAADGLLAGAVSASSLTGGTASADGWQPGDTDAATSQAGALGLDVPAGDGAGMQAAYLDAAARSLTDSQTAGLDPAAAGQALSDAVTDPGLAQNVVLNQVVTASAQAAEGVYEGQGIEQVNILNGPNPCPECQELSDTNPHAPGLIPLHPNCECVETPVKG